jgi:hypothetical protein
MFELSPDIPKYLLSAGLAFLLSWLGYRFKRKEIIDKARGDLEKSLEERIRREIIHWANPILGAVKDLEGRLRNILERDGYLALSEEYKEQVNPNWSISYAYFMRSTLYLFGQYFAWVRMLQEELNFELFQSHQQKDEIFNALEKVNRSLGSFPPKNYECSGKDTQVFRLQQRAIGELLIIREGDHRRCLSYPEFFQKLSDHQFNQHLEPLRSLLKDLNPKDDCRWKRLEATRRTLTELKDSCEELLALQEKS